MRTFTVVWMGQVISVVGSGLTSFALGLWVYQQTHSVTQFALIAFFATIPSIVLAPLAGVLVDRYDRRWMMIIGDTGAALSTMVVALLFFGDQLEIWHIYLATMVNTAFNTLQVPAYFAAITQLVSKEQYGRTSGMVQLAQALSEILAPTLAGALIVTLKLGGIIVIDAVTFIFATSTLLFIRFPQPVPEDAAVASAENEKSTFWQELTSGWVYLKTRTGLLGLLVFLTITTFLWSMIGTLITPMILAFTTEAVLGVMISCAGFGFLAGSLLMSTWGGPKRRITGVFGFSLLGGVFMALIGLRPSVILVTIGAIGAHFTLPIFNASNQAIWQDKVPATMQGRVFALRQAITRSAAPLAYLSAGTLADKVFGPLLVDDGVLADSVGVILGTGEGRGIGLLFMLMGTLVIIAAVLGYLNPRLRHIEDDLPDAV